jgi:hypothetical protein
VNDRIVLGTGKSLERLLLVYIYFDHLAREPPDLSDKESLSQARS